MQCILVPAFYGGMPTGSDNTELEVLDWGVNSVTGTHRHQNGGVCLLRFLTRPLHDWHPPGLDDVEGRRGGGSDTPSY